MPEGLSERDVQHLQKLVADFQGMHPANKFRMLEEYSHVQNFYLKWTTIGIASSIILELAYP